MLTGSLQITIDKRSADPKTRVHPSMAAKDWCSIVYGYPLKSYSPERLHGYSGVSPSCVSWCQPQVPVDNQNLCRLDYRVAEATAVFYGKLTYTGGSFPPHVRASRPLVSPLAMPTDWIGRNLIHQVQWFSDIRDSKRISERCPHDARNESVKRRLLGPLLFAVREG